jgi:hypothetical protein
MTVRKRSNGNGEELTDLNELKHCSEPSLHIFILPTSTSSTTRVSLQQQLWVCVGGDAGGGVGGRRVFICHSLSTEASWECTRAEPFASRTSTFSNGVQKGQRWASDAMMSAERNRRVLGIQYNSKNGSQ